MVEKFEIVLFWCSFSVVFSNLFTDKIFYVNSAGVYSRGELYTISLIGPSLYMVMTLIKVITNKIETRQKVYLCIYPLLPFINTLLTIRIETPALTSIEFFCSIFFLYSNIYVRREQDIANMNIALSKARTELMVSQIHPHFVSNTLGMIRSMYRSDAENAEKAMNTFINYLQRNFSELGSHVPISFEREIEHVGQFTQLEQMRWPDIQVEYDLKCKNFYLPAMSLQPLVENAIRHGIMPLESGGTVTISSWEDDDNFYVQVADNGVGFDENDKNNPKEDYRKHIGISNISERIKLMCSGTLTLTSQKGVGTQALITLPKIGGGITDA